MIIPILLIVAGVILLYFGADWLVKGASRLAKQLGVRPLVIGLTVVAFGTSAPELFSSLIAQISLGAGSVAVGNVIGSNIYNLGLVLGLSALIYPIAIHSVVVRREAPICVLVTMMLIVFMWDGHLSRPEAFFLLICFISYTLFQYFEARRGRKERILSGEYAEAIDHKRHGAWWINVGLMLLGMIGLAVGAHLLVDNGVTMGRLFGISDRVIGLTVVAIGTSLPELATAAVAAAKKHSDLVVGNVIGSNIFNILLILGAVGAISPISFDPNLMRIDGVLMLAFTIVLMFLISITRQLRRWGGAALLGTAAIYTAYLYIS
jgi:cation:H+ antiporter